MKMKLLDPGSHAQQEVKARQDVRGHRGKKCVLFLLLLCITWWRVLCRGGSREVVSVTLSVWPVMVVFLSSTHCSFTEA